MNIRSSRRIIVPTLLATFVAFVPFAYAATESTVRAHFQKVIEVNPPAIKVPTVVEISVPPKGDVDQFFVEDLALATPTPSYLRTAYEASPEPLRPTGFGGRITTNGQGEIGALGAMVDEDPRSYAEFTLDGAKPTPQRVTFTLESASPITASSLSLSLDANVSLPRTIELSTSPCSSTADCKAPQTLTIAKRAVGSGAITFPRTTARSWTFALEYDQPLRITDISLAEEGMRTIERRYLRFLAQPGRAYRIYLEPDAWTALPRLPESGDLADDIGVRSISAQPAMPNPLFIMNDSDGDGHPDATDDCPSVANPDQSDIDQNGVGDACDDFDRDGVLNVKDNCPNEPNVGQSDVDGDGIGDACDKEESRFTEAHRWVPWVGMGGAALVLLTLVFLTLKGGGLPKPETAVSEGESERKDVPPGA